MVNASGLTSWSTAWRPAAISSSVSGLRCRASNATGAGQRGQRNETRRVKAAKASIGRCGASIAREANDVCQRKLRAAKGQLQLPARGQPIDNAAHLKGSGTWATDDKNRWLIWMASRKSEHAKAEQRVRDGRRNAQTLCGPTRLYATRCNAPRRYVMFDDAT